MMNFCREWRRIKFKFILENSFCKVLEFLKLLWSQQTWKLKVYGLNKIYLCFKQCRNLKICNEEFHRWNVFTNVKLLSPEIKSHTLFLWTNQICISIKDLCTFISDKLINVIICAIYLYLWLFPAKNYWFKDHNPVS